MQRIEIRKITPGDDEQIAGVIRQVLEQHGVPKIGTAYADPELDQMSAAYLWPASAYFVLEKDGQILGGAGIAPLREGGPEVCELQKMYFLPEARGQGFGSMMMDKCLEAAREFGYKKCYLETMAYMEPAQKLYRKSGFEYLERPMGDTGHGACGVWMIKSL